MVEVKTRICKIKWVTLGIKGYDDRSPKPQKP